jgi:DNA repair protein RecO (recombination protein O)
MEWTDEGIVLGTRRHGEGNAILELMTRAHGRHLGLVRGGAGTRLRPVLQPGNGVQATWRARLDQHLGYFMVEGLELRAAAFLGDAHALYGIGHIAALCRLLPERDPHPSVHAALTDILSRFDDRALLAAGVARFELQMLAELGFGLDLDSCAVTGEALDLVYVSPKSGRAVSRAAGAPWHGRLLQLPPFLRAAEAETASEPPSADELAAAFALTGFFLQRHVLAPHGLALSDAREHFLAAVARPMAMPAAPVG